MKVGNKIRIKSFTNPSYLNNRTGHISHFSKEGNPVVKIEGEGSFLYLKTELELINAT